MSTPCACVVNKFTAHLFDWAPASYRCVCRKISRTKICKNQTLFTLLVNFISTKKTHQRSAPGHFRCTKNVCSSVHLLDLFCGVNRPLAKFWAAFVVRVLGMVNFSGVLHKVSLYCTRTTKTSTLKKCALHAYNDLWFFCLQEIGTRKKVIPRIPINAISENKTHAKKRHEFFRRKISTLYFKLYKNRALNWL